jgi:hypothetical protein
VTEKMENKMIGKANDNTRKIFVNGRKVGTVVGETFYKEIRGSKHIMRNPHAIFFDIASLREVESCGAKFIHIIDKETGDVYTCSLSDVWQYAIYKNYGFGEQVGLAANRFNVTTTQAHEYEPATISFAEYEKTHHTVEEKRVGQLSLFGGG